MRGSAGRLLDGEGRKSETDHWAGVLGWGVPVQRNARGAGLSHTSAPGLNLAERPPQVSGLCMFNIF